MPPFQDVAHHPAIKVGNWTILIRLSVDIREWSQNKEVIYYLSILSDEIDGRFDKYQSRLRALLGQAPPLEALRKSSAYLELTDSVIYCDGIQLIIVRGSSSNFPLYRNASGILSTMLPSPTEQCLSKSGMVTYMTADLITGINEPNATLTTPFKHSLRVRRGALTVLNNDHTFSEIPFPVKELPEKVVTIEDIVLHLRMAFDEFAVSQQRVNSSVLELSGGFASTLAGTFALGKHHVMRGFSAVYPYYEFQHEAPIQQLVADNLKITRTVIDGSEYLPYSRVVRRPWVDEPSKFMTGAKFTEAVGQFALSKGAEKIYVGHGGDDLFDTDTNDLRLLISSPDRNLFTKNAWSVIQATVAKMNKPEWMHNNSGLFTYDGRLDVWTKECYQTLIRSPFTDMNILYAARLWSSHCRSKKRIVDKSILVSAFSDILPSALLERKGKIRYEGVWARAYRLYGNYIADLIEDSAEMFETIGVLPCKLISRIQDLQNYRSDCEKHVIAAFAIADWLQSHQLKRAGDVCWIE